MVVFQDFVDAVRNDDPYTFGLHLMKTSECIPAVVGKLINYFLNTNQPELINRFLSWFERSWFLHLLTDSLAEGNRKLANALIPDMKPWQRASIVLDTLRRSGPNVMGIQDKIEFIINIFDQNHVELTYREFVAILQSFYEKISKKLDSIMAELAEYSVNSSPETWIENSFNTSHFENRFPITAKVVKTYNREKLV